MADATITEYENAMRLAETRNRDALKSAGMIAGRIAAHVATGGVGKIVRVETERRLRGAISGVAERVAAHYTGQEDDVGEEDEEGGSQEKRAAQNKKLQGAGFWFVFGLVCAVEVVNFFLDFTLVLSLLTTILGLMTSFVVYFYLATQGISFSQRRLAMWLISILIEIIPFLNILPAFPIMLLIMRYMENSEFLQNKLKLAEKIV